ncbi:MULTISPECIES: DUF4870 domain-containing protein [Pseudomonas]|jgi:uncharacterized Tic20 family protein|uniref:Orotate phosphoribosyltransferase n=1 Tax=Pseudomonas extremorientalis TaxID=169669 RepID=A0A1H0SPN4_9PSED|nr:MULTISPECIES: DUF4870 domain-containing protein [Pseudomonas]KAB0517916.1 DUF4870 domain-containing protein [Pseudomonas extremorientalis]OIN13325.1 orotate phosphoribosyltransferase [Pseudomonas extremorientalis]PMV18258.1 DUF4870 domain-containing protein [Pseudomonas sp. FW305-3-2-15-C-TSA2]PMV30676.1 DUF4870 domain-containing protein [Pseudomonas sp. DP16D-L5]PMV40882.1 DUF4870 domain-containing protein [Pseudomonas sp. FW305-3-2-15-A-LB2]
MNDSSQMPVPTPSYEVRQGAMLCHLAAFLGFVFPFGSVVGPLILWQMKKEVDPFIDDQGKEALNFQITVAIAWIACIVLAFAVIGFFLMVALAIATVVLTIIGSIKANKGIAYRYPLTWRVIK